ncbi:hypothetical protein ACIBVL_09815 [Streptomyces sp. NPDC049687]|uniref:hypothetical protein n=1 Tax=Streptomyces sp. NPDC049687 TaxID=3365596 RepID=UPI00378B5855
MTSTSLIIALSIVVICAASAFSFRNEPPFWMVLSVCVATYPVNTWLLDTSVLAGVGNSFVGEWSVRLAVVSVVCALLSPFIGKGWSGRRSRAAHEADADQGLLSR